MKVKLSDIQPATPRVRKELNLDKLDELAESIKETGGVIVPVKLRKNGKGYTTVYGHRRIEAARQAGFTEIEAWIADVDDDELLTQALIENVVREDMQPLDIAKAFKQIKEETGWTNERVGAKFGMGEAQVRDYLQQLIPEIQAAIESVSRPIPYRHVKEATIGTETKEDAAKVLRKAGKEELTQRQTRKVAEEYTSAKRMGGQKMADLILRTPFERIHFTPPPPPPPKPKVREPKGEVVFSWVREPRIVFAYDGIKAVGVALDYILANKGRETGAAIQVAKQMRKFLAARLEQADAVIGELENVS